MSSIVQLETAREQIELCRIKTFSIGGHYLRERFDLFRLGQHCMCPIRIIDGMVLCSSGRGSNRAQAALVVTVMLQMFAMSHWSFFILRRVLETYLKRTCNTYFKRTSNVLW